MDNVTATSALLSFSAENVRSIRDRAELSLLSTRIAQPTTPRLVEMGGGSRPARVSPGAGLFGANASGKSNILKAMADMRWLVLTSFRSGSDGTGMTRHPFRLDPSSHQRVSAFAIDVVVNGRRYQYGFEIDDHQVVSEYALHYPKGRQALLFERDAETIEYGPPMRSEGRGLERWIRSNALVLSVAGSGKRSVLGDLFRWFGANLRLADSTTRGLRAARTAELAAADDASKARVLALLRAADLGVTEITCHPLDPEVQDRLRRAVRILSGQEGEPDDEDDFVVEDFVRLTHCSDGHCTEFDPQDESVGTLVWVGVIGPVIDALDTGSVLLADELDASLHPHLVRQLIRLFQDPVTNPRCAQLIFNAHDPTILGDHDEMTLGRDQIWFTEKLDDGTTRLYPLSDFGPRKDDSIERRYLGGRYGGVPILNPAEFERAMELA